MYRDYVKNIDDLSTGLGVSEAEGGLGLPAWEEGSTADSVGVKGGKEIVGIMSENSSVRYLPCLRPSTVPTHPGIILRTSSEMKPLDSSISVFKVKRHPFSYQSYRNTSP